MNKITVKQYAKAAGISTQAAYKATKTRLKPYVIREDGRLFLDAAALSIGVQPLATELPTIDNQVTNRYQPQGSIENATENSNLQEAENQPVTNQVTNQLPTVTEALSSAIEALKEQLEEQRKQLAVKDQQIADLNARLAEAMQLTRGQQYIAAADKTADLMAASAADQTQPEQPEEKPKTEKRSFWARLFGKGGTE